MAVCFLGFLAAGLAACLLRDRQDVSFWENRMLAALPQPGPESVADGSYFTQMERYLADHAPLRTTLLKLKTRCDLTLGLPVVNDVVVTRDSLLPFLPYGIDSQEDIDRWAGIMADNLAGINAAVTEYGGDFFFGAGPPPAPLIRGGPLPVRLPGGRVPLVPQQRGPAQSDEGRVHGPGHGGAGRTLPGCGGRSGPVGRLGALRLPGGQPLLHGGRL